MQFYQNEHAGKVSISFGSVFFNIFVFEQLHEKYEHSSRREKRRRQLENHERPWADLGHGAAII